MSDQFPSESRIPPMAEPSAQVSEPVVQDSRGRSSSTANAAQRRAQLSQQPRFSLGAQQSGGSLFSLSAQTSDGAPSARAQDDLLLDQTSRAQLIARTDELSSRQHASDDSHRSVTPAVGLLSNRFDQIRSPSSLQQRSSSGGGVGVQRPPERRSLFDSEAIARNPYGNFMAGGSSRASTASSSGTEVRGFTSHLSFSLPENLQRTIDAAHAPQAIDAQPQLRPDTIITMAHLHQLFPALFGDRVPVAEPFDLWPKSAYPATLDIYDQGPDAPPLSDSQRDVLRHTRSGAIAPVYNGDQLTIDGLYPFLQAWKDYRLHYGQKDLITSFSEQIIITLALKFWPDLSGDPLTLFRRNFIGPENEPVLFRMLHEFFQCSDTASARTSLEQCARLYAQSYPFRQPSRAIQWLLGYYDKFYRLKTLLWRYSLLVTLRS